MAQVATIDSIPPLSAPAVQLRDPYTTITYKLNSYIAEAAVRNGELNSLHLWLFMRATDIDWNGAPTGRVYGINRLVPHLARVMHRSVKTIHRQLQRAEADGYLLVDMERDRVHIPSRTRLTWNLWRDDFSGPPLNGKPLPDAHMRHPYDILEIPVRIPEVWDPSRGIARSRTIDIVRQRATEYGWCRDTVGRLVGMARTSTARLDRNTGARRGWQFAYMLLADIVPHTLPKEDLENFGREMEIIYSHSRTVHHGRGQKVWLGRTSEGSPAIFTQLPVKWDTPFGGRFRDDQDFQAYARTRITPTMLNGYSVLHSTRSLTDSRVRKPEILTTVLSESMRDSLWRLVRELTSNMVSSFPINTRPTVQLVDHLTWPSWTARSPNRRFRRTKKMLKTGEDDNVE